ncbi:flagellar basal-body rod protein FlgC [Geomicrobium halophilum]|uniref:Flagellar basal-body rod protein FlgC n=1 Tax=Geomicrobium halophilum TaxID=549000 RepID=A0A841PXR7_9BACL|nr:flagellar basal body rod protein FlgC [Geomicrobium halophilum]MBB6449303.1 flagellar basal-body rod protein FlgC [Geomicrobium halophilum]
MSLFEGMNATASALTAQRLRMDAASSNMANVETTRGRMVDGEWEPYRRRIVTMAPQENQHSFASQLRRAEQEDSQGAAGVKVSGIVEDGTPFQTTYQPEHPDADEEGYLELPNVDPLKEMVDVMGATRSYEANATVFDAHKGMMMKTMEIGRS